MYIIEGIEAIVRTFNTSKGDWSGETFSKDNPYNDRLKELTRKSLIESLSNMLYIDIDFHHVYIQDDIISVSVNENGDGYLDENGSYLVDYIFIVNEVSSVNIDNLLKEGAVNEANGDDILIEGVNDTNEIEYPYFYEREHMALDKRFNGELCHHTGRVMVNGETPADEWNEYIDSQGEFHYGR